jgi:hypothetical protein
MTPLCLSQQCQLHRCACHTAESMKLLCMSPQCHKHRCATNLFLNSFANNSTHCFHKEICLGCTWHRGVIDAAVTCTAVSLTPLCKYDTAVTLDLIFERLWLPLKGITIKKIYIGKLSCIPITFTQKIWGLTRYRFLSQQCHLDAFLSVRHHIIFNLKRTVTRFWTLVFSFKQYTLGFRGLIETEESNHP